jgi:hypothetical protein
MHQYGVRTAEVTVLPYLRLRQTHTQAVVGLEHGKRALGCTKALDLKLKLFVMTAAV